MIVSQTKKIAVFLNPKTGTETLSTIFKNVESVDYCEHEHANYHKLLANNPNKSYLGFKFYCFFRDPVERFISAYNYQRRAVTYYQQFLYYFCGDIASDVSCADVTEYRDLPQKTKDLIESVTIDEFLDSRFIEDVSAKNGSVLFCPQVRWLSVPVKVNLLNYDNFVDGVHFLAEQFGGEIRHIPRMNESVKVPSAPLTAKQIDKIRDIYKDDYRFFRSKNIIFE